MKRTEESKIKLLSDKELKAMEEKCRAMGAVIWGYGAPSPKMRERVFMNSAEQDTAPAAIFERWRSLSGDEKQDYFTKNKAAIWDHYERTKT